MRLRVLAGLAFALAVAIACGLNIDSGGVLCGPVGECPESFECRVDGYCYRSGVGLSTTCDDGVVDLGETCDPADSCPADCEDGNSCTLDTRLGKAQNCNVGCIRSLVADCEDDDGCCPETCSAENDDDCSASCDDGTIDDNETCNPPETCPSSCSDGNACTVDTRTGSEQNCNVACVHLTIGTCVGGDGCCPVSCNNTNDSDCSVSCGNSTIEPGETCDPPGSCPTSCNDSNSCTVNIRLGNPSNCNVTCSNTPVVTCANGDGCCPAGCNNTIDDDCSASCGNSVVEPGETCDPPGSCPASCNDANACTSDSLLGSASNCNVSCSNSPIVSCGSGDGCCPNGCNSNNDGECSASCGNSAIEAGETCDPPASCPASCDDLDACTLDTLTGSPANCNSSCSTQAISSCQTGDGCCPGSCFYEVDQDCDVCATYCPPGFYHVTGCVPCSEWFAYCVEAGGNEIDARCACAGAWCGF